MVFVLFAPGLSQGIVICYLWFVICAYLCLFVIQQLKVNNQQPTTN